MKSHSHSRIIVTAVALFSLLFMQLALASYTCPMMTMGSDYVASISSDQMTMTDCDGLDMAQPTLCHAHASGETTKQSLDKSELPPVHPFVPAELMLALEFVTITPTSSTSAHESISLARATSPPLAIRHCCFRI